MFNLQNKNNKTTQNTLDTLSVKEFERFLAVTLPEGNIRWILQTFLKHSPL